MRGSFEGEAFLFSPAAIRFETHLPNLLQGFNTRGAGRHLASRVQRGFRGLPILIVARLFRHDARPPDITSIKKIPGTWPGI